jgi:hypothetical protein
VSAIAAAAAERSTPTLVLAEDNRFVGAALVDLLRKIAINDHFR